MKIAINARFLLKNKMSGIGHFTNELLQRLTKNHPEHEFIFLFDRPFSEDFIYSKNIKPVILFPPARHPLLFIWWFELSIPRYLKKNNIDVFISPDNFLSLRANVASVLVIHDLAFKHYPENIPWVQRIHYQYFMPKFAKKASKIVTVSNATREDIINTYQINKEKIDVIHLGAKSSLVKLNEDEKIRIRNANSNGFEYFINVSTIEPRKNFARLLYAFDKFKAKDKRNIKLLLVGSIGWKTNEIFKVFNKMKYKNDVIWLGYVSENTLTELINAALCLTFVSVFEGFGLPIIEANTCGCPVITSNISSMPEVGKDAVYYINPFSTESIANGMLEIANNKKLRKELILNGYKNKDRFSWDKSAKLLWEAVEKVVDMK